MMPTPRPVCRKVLLRYSRSKGGMPPSSLISRLKTALIATRVCWVKLLAPLRKVLRATIEDVVNPVIAVVRAEKAEDSFCFGEAWLPLVTMCPASITSDFGQWISHTITICVPVAAVEPATCLGSMMGRQDTKKAIARPISIGEGWYISTDRWLAKTDGEKPTNKATTSVAYCFCSEGNVCCNSPHGVQCDFGICGI
ncbi:hypothetical protein HYQ46_004017 [Verticillium longisporum]|nr:hypothetical protein HYQ46_004017 [Verticillium longisporum]